MAHQTIALNISQELKRANWTTRPLALLRLVAIFTNAYGATLLIATLSGSNRCGPGYAHVQKPILLPLTIFSYLLGFCGAIINCSVCLVGSAAMICAIHTFELRGASLPDMTWYGPGFGLLLALTLQFYKIFKLF